MAEESKGQRAREAGQRLVKHPALLASLVSILSVTTVGWQVAKRILTPFIVTAVQQAVADDTAKKINAKTVPILDTLKGMKEAKVAEMDDEIQLQTLRKQRAGGNASKWTELDELKLSQLKRRLEEERKKLRELEQEAIAAMAGSQQ